MVTRTVTDIYNTQHTPNIFEDNQANSSHVFINEEHQEDKEWTGI